MGFTYIKLHTYITCNDTIKILGGEAIDLAFLIFRGAFAEDVFHRRIGVAEPFDQPLQFTVTIKWVPSQVPERETSAAFAVRGSCRDPRMTSTSALARTCSIICVELDCPSSLGSERSQSTLKASLEPHNLAMFGGNGASH